MTGPRGLGGVKLRPDPLFGARLLQKRCALRTRYGTSLLVNRRGFLVLGAVVGAILMAILVQLYHVSASPKVCTGCHSMVDLGSTWQRSNHKQFACVECHMPAGNIASKLFYKTRAGLHDLWHETIRDYPASLALSAGPRTVVHGNCLRCHQSTVERVTMIPGAAISCTKCHRRTMHRKLRKMEE